MSSGSQKISTRLGFILISVGCAVGIGNVWRFPYVAGEYGGGIFVLTYLLCLLLLGVPILTMEFAAGRAASSSLALLHKRLRPDKPLWRIHGLWGLTGNTLLMMFYTTVSGWMAIYFVKSLCSGFEGITAQSAATEFSGLLQNWPLQFASSTVMVVVAAIVCVIGVEKGVERVSKWMMSSLFILITLLAIRSCTLDGAIKGVQFYLLPNIERVRQIGLAKLLGAAMNQAFFTLSLGVGSMAIFGSYIDKKRSLLGESISVACLDTFVAIIAGLVVIPACFACGVSPSQGPGLVFVTLPNVFIHMPYGQVCAAMFFLLMSFAAFSTVLAVFEAIVASLCDYLSISRRKICVIVAISLTALALPCIFGFNLWKDISPMGKGTTILDLEDFVLSTFILPFGALAFVLFCTLKCGWGWEGFLKEANSGQGIKMPRLMRVYCRWVLPLIVIALFIYLLGNL
ncbi:MAG: sodium-dependent transporter [Kiritimatiellae bacterium]|nr:sodium-dependent transporter [Kiritimatiellia bacterium]